MDLKDLEKIRYIISKGDISSYEGFIYLIKLSKDVFSAVNSREPNIKETIDQMVKIVEDKPPFLI